MDTYISISIMVYSKTPDWNSGRIYFSCDSKNLDLHLDVPYEQAKKELAKLMLRTGKMPDIVGKHDDSVSTMYMLSAFLD